MQWLKLAANRRLRPITQ
jgi:hypothetical protein